MDIQKKLTCTICLLGFVSCSWPGVYTKFFVKPDWPRESLSPEIKKIGIAFTSNFQHYLIPHKTFILDSKNEQKYSSVGGVSALKRYIDIFKKMYGENQVLINTGSIFQNNADIAVKNQIFKFYDEMDYDAVGLTDHNLIDMLEREEFYQTNQIPLLAGNIIDLRTGKPLSKASVIPYKIIERNGVKVGLLALTALKILSKEERRKFKGVYFEDPVTAFLRTKQIFRKHKVDIAILLAHMQDKCSSTANHTYLKGNKKYLPPIACSSESQGLAEFVNRLPPRSIDLIITSKDNFAMGYLRNIPVAQLKGDGKYLGTVEIYYNTNKRRISTAKNHFLPTS